LIQKRLRDIHKNEELYQLLVNTITDYAIFMLDREGKVSSWHRGAERFKGYHAHEIIFSRFYTQRIRQLVFRRHPRAARASWSPLDGIL